MNIKNLFSTPGKKALGMAGLLVFSAGMVYGVYNTQNRNLLKGEILNAIPPKSIQSPALIDANMVEVWLAAGQGMTVENGKVVEWQDLSGNKNHAVAKAEYAPTLVKETEKGEFNFQPIVRFDGANDYLQSSLEKGGYGNEIFIVFRSLQDPISYKNPVPGQTVLGFDDPTVNNANEISGVNIGDSVPANDDYPANEAFTFATGKYRAGLHSENYGYPAMPLILRVENTEELGTRLSINGIEGLINGTSKNQPFHYIKDLPWLLGSNAGKNKFFKGDIAEVIMLNNKATEEEVKKIEKYLGLKYGVAIGSKEDYTLDPASQILAHLKNDGDYSHSPFGIGRYDALGLNIGGKGSTNELSQSSNLSERILSIGQASDLSNGDFVIISNNVGNNKWSNQFTKEGGELLSRKWRMEESSIALTGEQQEADEGVGSVVISVEVDQEFNISTPAEKTTYALAFFKDDHFNGVAAKKYVTLNDEGSNGDLKANDGKYSGTLDNLEGLAYFTLVKFGPNPPALVIHSAEQIKTGNDSGKVAVKTTITDLNKEGSIQMLVEFESDQDSQCNGPWIPATLVNPITSSQGVATLFSATEQAQNEHFQLSNISTLNGSENKVDFIWDAKTDVPTAFNTLENSGQCLRILVKDQALEGDMKTFGLKVAGSAPALVFALAIVSPAENDQVNGNMPMTGSCQPGAKVVVKNTLFAQPEYTSVCNEAGKFNVATVWKKEALGTQQTVNAQQIDANNQVSETKVMVNVSQTPVEPVQPIPETPKEEAPVEEEAKTSTITLKVTGPTSLASANMSVSKNIANNVNVANNATKDYVVEAEAEYQITCQEDVPGHFLLNTENPTVIDEGLLVAGAQAIVTCEYAEGDADVGTVEFDEEVAETLFETETACLEYKADARSLEFSDIDLKATGGPEAMLLKNTYLLHGDINQNLNEFSQQFVLSGEKSTIGEVGALEAKVNLEGTMTRVDALKLIMTTFCIPIFNEESVSGQENRIDNLTMPVYVDPPRKGTVAANIIASASVLGIVEGKDYQSSNNRIDWKESVTNAEFLKMLIRAVELWQGYQEKADVESARALGIEEEWYLAFYARALSGSNGERPIKRFSTILNSPQSPATRGQLIAYLTDTLLESGLYKDPTTVTAALEELRK